MDINHLIVAFCIRYVVGIFGYELGDIRGLVLSIVFTDLVRIGWHYVRPILIQQLMSDPSFAHYLQEPLDARDQTTSD